ncbi:MAG: DNA polymerase III subunit beta [Myxococcota bacterium]
MELTISKKDFLRGLARTHAVADRKSSMPILSNVLLSADGTQAVRLAATDLYLGINAQAPARIDRGGSVAVSARTLFDIVKNLPDGDVSLKVGENHAVELRCGKVRYKIPGMPGDDFPPLPNPEDATFVEIDANVVGDLIALTQYSMSTDDTRPHLAGALFEGDGKVARMVTTDGHRLSKAERKLGEGAPMMNFSMLIPHKGVSELRRLIEDARTAAGKGEDTELPIAIATSGGNAFFQRDDIHLNIKLADEQFPPYAKVIPQQQSRKVTAQRAALVEALRRISLVANDKSGGVRLSLEPGLLRITSENPDVGEGSEELDVDFAGEPVVIGFNARYLLDALGGLTEDEVAIELSGELDPGAIKPVGSDYDFVGVIMPMRI